MPEEEHPDPKRIVEAGYDLIGERYGKMCATKRASSVRSTGVSSIGALRHRPGVTCAVTP